MEGIDIAALISPLHGTKLPRLAFQLQRLATTFLPRQSRARGFLPPEAAGRSFAGSITR